MVEVVSADAIEGVVGAMRHAVHHIGRAVTSEQRVYILHSEQCRARPETDLRQCPYSAALDRGIDPKRWEGFEDQPVRLWFAPFGGLLIPDASVWIEARRAEGREPDASL